MSIDFTLIQEASGGDPAIERELFRLFLETGSHCREKLQAALSEQQENDWREAAHELKGASLSLGANQLGRLCKQAEYEEG